jgi:hypothetical protein
VRNTASVAAGGIEGFATANSIQKGGSVDLKVNAATGSTFNIEIYRTGYYGGAEARLFSVIRNVPAVQQPACASAASTTGLLDCSNWSVSATLTTTSNWPSGAYVLRLVRNDTGTDNQILLVVRDDARSSDILYGVGFSTYEAYNNYGGKSLYDFNSSGNTTDAGTTRAVKVSFDRPFEQPRSGLRDWYTRNETGMVSWLEQEGYDVSYIANTDLETNGSLALGHKAYISPAHDEYVSANMRAALKNARDAGVGLFFSGSNAVYWKIRFEPDNAGNANRTQVCYKSTQSGGPDPSGIPTGTWRDPAGANQPENALIGEMYVGDNDTTYFPLVVSASQGADRIYRYTPLSSQNPGTSTTIGNSLVGWEWDARFANGAEPNGVVTLAGSPVSGELIQNNGANTTPGSTTATVTKYTAASGALVFATGTNHWARGLAPTVAGVGEPDQRIQQVTTNVLADMGAQPATPASGIVLDNANPGPPPPTGVTATATGSDSVQISWKPVTGADGYNVYRSLSPRSGGQPLGARANGSLVTGTSFTDTGLSSTTTYYYAVTAVVSGAQSNASADAQATTLAAAGQTIRIEVGGSSSYVSSTGATWQADSAVTGGTVRSVSGSISGTNDPAIYRTERWGQFTYSIPVPNGTYDVRFHFAELYYGVNVPGGPGKRVFGMDITNTAASPDLANIDIYAAVGPMAAYVRTVSGVTVSNGVLTIKSVYGSADDPTLEGLEIVPVSASPTVTSTTPTDGATGVSAGVQPTATFSRAMDPSTITSSTFSLVSSGGASVAGTVSYDSSSSTATFAPTSALAPSTTYTAKLSTGVQASDGTPLASAVSWTFTTQAPQPPQVTSTTPSDGATGISASVAPRATFSRSMDPSTLTAGTFTLTGPSGTAVPGTVTYDDTTHQATLTPTGALASSTTYTAKLSTAVSAADGAALANPVSWSFTTSDASSGPPTVVDRAPAAGATGVAVGAGVTATFSTAMDPTSITTSSFTLAGPSGNVAGTVTYDSTTKTATMSPAAALSYSTTYTATVAGTVHASDGTPLGSPATWTFTTAAPPPPPTVTATAPTSNATLVSRSATISATFSRAMDPSTITTSSFTVVSGGNSLTGVVSYDSATSTASFAPSIPLPGGATVTARLDATVAAADGTPMSGAVTWTFTTAACPCSLFSPSLVPTKNGLPVRDGRSGTGPWSYELGVKIVADQTMSLTDIRFYKQPGETGTHVGTVWTTSGAKLATVTFTNESASGWQQATLGTPVTMQAGTVYVVSVNANAYFGTTTSGLATQIVSGPLSSAPDPANGVYGSAAGVFPTQSYKSTNYFVDVSAVPTSSPAPPTVTSTTPTADATKVSIGTTVRATFSRAMNAGTITPFTFTLTDGGGNQVAAAVSYSGSTATLTPNAPLSYGTKYTASLSQSILASDGTPLASTQTWSFTTASQPPPLSIASTTPTQGATGVARDATVQVTFNRGVDPNTLTASTFHLLAPDGTTVAASIAYDAASFTAQLKPSALLSATATYTVELTAGIQGSDDGAALSNPGSWTLTTAACPCQLFSSTLTPSKTGNAVQDGRTGAGPWSRELGVKITVTQNTTLTAIRFYKDAKETGTHTGSIWTQTGTKLASVTFSGETSSGWQQATLATPVTLQAGTVYVVSVGFNAYYDVTPLGLQTQIVSGPLRSVADGANGVYSAAAGTFPTSSYNQSNYFIDVRVS